MFVDLSVVNPVEGCQEFDGLAVPRESFARGGFDFSASGILGYSEEGFCHVQTGSYEGVEGDLGQV